ncbi:MAG: thioredoxin domain-containing protein [Christensenellales bacterium]
MNTSRQPNRLIGEQSPYLLQHAYNPVNWYPWGEEAFSRAKAEDKPVFLSIGYSTCHWCHVMEHESFEDESVAKLLNEHFVAVKVDREERPDIDAVYMNVCQTLTGSGGWPLTILLTPDQQPFYAATYLPKDAKYGMLGIKELLSYIRIQWLEDKTALLSAGSEITAYLNEKKESLHNGIPLSRGLFEKALRIYAMQFDKEYGGFNSSPKFPSPHHLLFLLRYGTLEKKENAAAMAEKTLEQMYRGGLFDHIGGGFSRYSTDKKWLVPHFEKMLYDNAMLLHAYLEAYRLTGKELYRYVSQKTIRYVLREMRDASGGFYCAQDADSDGVEGKYYVFPPDEIIKVLGSARGNAFSQRYSVTQEGNFEGMNIPNLIGFTGDLIPNKSMENTLDELYAYRLSRTKLHTDDKILTSWNALMISALAKAAVVLGSEECLAAARLAEAFLFEKLSDGKSRLYVRYRKGEHAGTGTLDDYAFYLWALLELYSATFNADYLKKAVDFARTMIHAFFDEDHGGFYIYGSGSEQLIARPKEVYDGAMPSGNSAAAYALGRLVRLTADDGLEKARGKQITFINETAQRNPFGFSFGLLALMDVLYPGNELVCVLSNENQLQEVRRFAMQHPGIAVVAKTPENSAILEEAAPYTRSYQVPEQDALYYLCTNHACTAPVTSLEALHLK